MYGPHLYVAKIMSVFFNMDSMIGKDFETGLTALKQVAEASATTPTAQSARP